MYLSESLADVKQRWSGNRVSEVGGREQQRRHFKVDKLETQKTKHTVNLFVIYRRKKMYCAFLCPGFCLSDYIQVALPFSWRLLVQRRGLQALIRT